MDHKNALFFSFSGVDCVVNSRTVAYILNQVEQPDDGPFGLGYVLDLIQVKLFERHDPSRSASGQILRPGGSPQIDC